MQQLQILNQNRRKSFMSCWAISLLDPAGIWAFGCHKQAEENSDEDKVLCAMSLLFRESKFEAARTIDLTCFAIRIA